MNLVGPGVAICLLVGCSSSAGSSSASDALIPGAWDVITCSVRAVAQAVEVLAPYPGSSETVSASTVLASYRRRIASVEAVTCMQGLGYRCDRHVCAGIAVEPVVVKFLGDG